MFRRVRALAALTLGLLLPSCIVAAAAVGAAAFGLISHHQNEVWMDFHADLPQVWEAASQSLTQNGYTPDPTATLGLNDGDLPAGDARVRVERHRDFVRAKVSVGTFDSADNKRLAELILQDIKTRLMP